MSAFKPIESKESSQDNDSEKAEEIDPINVAIDSDSDFDELPGITDSDDAEENPTFFLTQKTDSSPLFVYSLVKVKDQVDSGKGDNAANFSAITPIDANNVGSNVNDGAVGGLVEGTNANSAKQTRAGAIPKMSKGEQKARKILMQLGLEKINGVSSVTYRNKRGVIHIIDEPDVYKCNNINTYIVFGEIKIRNSADCPHLNVAPCLAPQFSPSSNRITIAKTPLNTMIEEIGENEKENENPAVLPAEPIEKEIGVAMSRGPAIGDNVVPTIIDNDDDLLYTIFNSQDLLEIDENITIESFE